MGRTMIDFPFVLKRNREKTNILLEVGTETVKALLFKEHGQKIEALTSACEYFDRYGVFDSRDFEGDVFKKAISRAIQKLGANSEKSVILGLPADILKARVVCQNLKRLRSKENITEREAKQIYGQAIEKAKKNITQIFNQQSGILPSDIQFINLKILEIRVDGYRVPSLLKYDGQDLNFRILATFLPRHYLEKIKAIVESMDLKMGEVRQEAEGLNLFFKEKSDAIFLDIGGTISQIFMVRNGILEKIDEFPLAGQIFSKAISEKLGLREAEARILKERYSKGELSKESLDRIKDILGFACQVWFKNLELKLKEMSKGFLFPLDIVIFGGGSQLPDIKDILKKGEWNKSLTGGLRATILDNPQETPLFLIAYAALQR